MADSAALALPVLGLALLAALPAAAAELDLLPASQVWIDGTTDGRTWHCSGDSLSADFAVDAPAVELERRLDGWQRGPIGALLGGPGDLPVDWHVRMELRMPISALQCNDAASGAEMRRALRAEAYPVIGYRFRRLSEARYRPAGAVPVFELQSSGEISLAGASRSIEVEVTATRIDARRFRLRGGLPLRLLDFGIESPAGRRGVRGSEPLWLSFDLVVSLLADGGALVGGAG